MRHSLQRMRSSVWLAGLAAWWLATAAWAQHQAFERTPIDAYVAQPDEAFQWKVVSDQSSAAGRSLVIEFVSQNWLTEQEVNRTTWKHWLTVAVPPATRSSTALLWIGGGSNRNEAPSGPDGRLQTIARASNTLVAEVKMVPNQPLEFHGDGVPRTEDDLIAYTWNQFLETGDPRWPARNAMVKAAVRAMDVLQLLADQDDALPPLERFVVAGASKRGWTTWLTGAMDPRVRAIAPIVIDVLNVEPNIRHHFAAYGFWAPAVGDYVEHGITQKIGHPRMPDLIRLVDPYAYRQRLTMPKLILNAAGDQFFPPDSSHYYYDSLPGPKLIRYVANDDHSLKRGNALQTLIAWYVAILQERPLPEVSWQLNDDGMLSIRSDQQPIAARLYWCHNPSARDFRLETIGPAFQARELSPAARMDVPLDTKDQGWTAHFVELEYDVGAESPLVISTEVFILPDVLPFVDKRPDLPPSITVRCRMPAERLRVLASPQIPPPVAERVQDLRLDTETTSPDAMAVVYVNWVPVGRFEASGEAVAAWLSSLGAQQLEFRLESGRPEFARVDAP
ncbi:MAG: hypothetical protein KatS3mg111_3000 [Pirellulaceae bacterium]|nr:MAG: hypothetical protein KatS3mg111_3000 [Pirellulaceae bacterium]